MGAGARSQATVRGVLEGQQPDGSETIRYTHAVPAEQPLLAFFQLFAALFFSSYFFFWIFGLVGLYLSMRWALLSMSGAALLLGVYVAQIMLYKPHKGKGWHTLCPAEVEARTGPRWAHPEHTSEFVRP